MEPELSHYQKYKETIIKNVKKNREKKKQEQIKIYENKIIQNYLQTLKN